MDNGNAPSQNVLDPSSMLLYVIIATVSFILAFLSQHGTILVKGKNDEGVLVEQRFSKFWFYLTFLFLWFFYAFSKSGTDYQEYLYAFNLASLNPMQKGYEAGYVLLSVIIKLFTKNAVFGLVIIKTISLIFLFSGLYHLRGKINISIAVLAYVAVFYFWSFNVIRIALSASIAFYALRFLINKAQIKYFFWVLVAFSIHFSAILLILVYIVKFIYDALPKLSVSFKVVIVCAALLISIFLVPILINALAANIAFMNKYASYIQELSAPSIGIGFFVINFYPVIITILSTQRYKQDSRLNSFSIIFLLLGLFISLLGYMSNILGRIAVFFSFPLLITVPYFHKNLALYKFSSLPIRTKSGEQNMYMFMTVAYLILRFVLYSQEMLFSNGMGYFTFIWQ